MKAIWNKVKENPLLSILSVPLIALGAVFLVVMFADCPQWIFNRLGITRTEEPKYEALKFLGIGMGGLLIALQALMSYRRAKAMEDAVEKTEQGQQQDRLRNAIEHLGHDKDSVRLGGAYELFHLAEDTEELRQTVLDILCAHIRQTTSEDKYREKYKSKPSEEIQSLLTLLFVQKHEVFKGCHIKLQESWLNGAELSIANLQEAELSRTHLQGAWLHEADLKGANLVEAQLQRAHLEKSYLRGANLLKAQLQGADLDEAKLQRAKLSWAYLQGVSLRKAQLQGAFLDKAKLQGANLFMAQLQGAYLELTGLHGAGNVEWNYLTPFANRIRMQIDKESDLSKVIFAGGLSQEDVESLVEGLSKEQANELREKLKSHIGKPRSNRRLHDGGITGSYTREKAERWIAEYEQAMSEVPEDDS